MSDRLTPEREAEIRRWNAGMIEANPECADECEYADFGDCEVCTPRVLLAALDACRRDLAEERARTTRLTEERDALLGERELGPMPHSCDDPDCATTRYGVGYDKCPGCGGTAGRAGTEQPA